MAPDPRASPSVTAADLRGVAGKAAVMETVAATEAAGKGTAEAMAETGREAVTGIAEATEAAVTETADRERAVTGTAAVVLEAIVTEIADREDRAVTEAVDRALEDRTVTGTAAATEAAVMETADQEQAVMGTAAAVLAAIVTGPAGQEDRAVTAREARALAGIVREQHVPAREIPVPRALTHRFRQSRPVIGRITIITIRTTVMIKRM